MDKLTYTPTELVAKAVLDAYLPVITQRVAALEACVSIAESPYINDAVDRWRNARVEQHSVERALNRLRVRAIERAQEGHSL